MDRNTRYILESHLSDLKARCRKEQHRAAQLSGYESRRLKEERNCYYSVSDHHDSRYRYLGKADNPEVLKIKEARFLQFSISQLQKEIQVIEKTLKMSVDTSYEGIHSKLPKAYRNPPISFGTAGSDIAKEWKAAMEKRKASYAPFRPEELIHTTNDGTLVRSKSEALIYNKLLEAGVTFVYELPLAIKFEGKNMLMLPDFSALCELDFRSTKYLEHQGMMGENYYRRKFNDSVTKYWSNNIIPERDVFFTFDLPNGGFDITPVDRLIRTVIRPYPYN